MATVDGRKGRDRAYERKRAATPALAEAQRLRNTAAWQKFRRWFKGERPLCFDPFGWHRADNRAEPTAEIHHIIGLETRPDLAFDEDNCAALCTRCHAKVEGMTKAGKSTAGLFGDGGVAQ